MRSTWLIPTCLALAIAAPAGFAQEAVLLSLDAAVYDDAFRLEVRLSGDAPHRVWQNVSPAKVVVDLGARLGDSVRLPETAGHPVVQRVRAQPGPLGARVVIDLAYPLPPPEVRRDGDTLFLRLPTRFRTIDERPVRPGLWYGVVRAGERDGPVRATYLRVDLRQPDLRVDVGAAGETFGLAPLREIAAAVGALAGVNGGYFHWSGRPLGLLVRDGRLVSGDVHGRTALTLGHDGTVRIGSQRVEMFLEGPGGRLAVDGINRPRNPGEVVVYTPEYGPLPAPGGARLVVAGGAVVQAGDSMAGVEAGDVAEGGDATEEEAVSGGAGPGVRAPAGGFVVEYGPERSLPGGWGSGMPVRFGWRLIPGHPGGVRAALGGGPQLLRDGAVEVTGSTERFQPDVLFGRAPRTAVGVTAAGELLLVVADGRDPSVSRGLTLEELAELMRDLGAVTAMNLDGGGSSTLVLKGYVMNRPSGGAERPVGNGLFVLLQDGS